MARRKANGQGCLPGYRSGGDTATVIVSSFRAQAITADGSQTSSRCLERIESIRETEAASAAYTAAGFRVLPSRPLGPQGSTPFSFCLKEPVGKTTAAVWPCRFTPPPDVGGSLRQDTHLRLEI